MALKYEKIKNRGGSGLLGKLWSSGLFTLVLFFGAILYGVSVTKTQVMDVAAQKEGEKSRARITELQNQFEAMKKASDDLKANLAIRADAISQNTQKIKEVRDSLERALASVKKSPKAKAQTQKLISESVEKVTTLQQQNQRLVDELVAQINPSQE